MKTMYSPKEFGELIGKSVITLQKWDRKGILKAHRSPTNRRSYKKVIKDAALQKNQAERH